MRLPSCLFLVVSSAYFLPSYSLVAPSQHVSSERHTNGRSFSPTIASMASVVEEQQTTSESAVFPPPLTSFGRIQRAATFWSTAIPIVANYYGLLSNLKLQELMGSPQTDEDIEVRLTFSDGFF